ncbi:MAG TPA: Nif3-like dinuclear metal center hexameric protein [Bacteroides sp.]|nr:Nif3-like dinuclear metal center hexameric protein [Bacteroides sp.]
MKVREITSCIESFAPLTYQESYDNAGLQTGDPSAEVSAALLCIDVTEEVIKEAVRLDAGLIISHHPVIFGGLKQLTGSTPAERVIMEAIRQRISIYSAHTNLDAVHNGVSHRMAAKIGLSSVRVLSPLRGKLRKLVFFVPVDNAPNVRSAIFEAGAGQIGEYDMCSFNAAGEGTFRGSEASDPYVGEKGKMHSEPELRVETIFPHELEGNILNALVDAHPYDEVAYDVYPLENVYDRAGMGVIGELEGGMDETSFLDLLKKNYGIPMIRHSRLLGRKVHKVALCGGSGGFLLGRAIASGADVFVTGDVRYHPFFDADGKIMMADIGHYESEQFTTEIFYDLLLGKFSNFAVHLTEVNTNPVNYY